MKQGVVDAQGSAAFGSLRPLAATCLRVWSEGTWPGHPSGMRRRGRQPPSPWRGNLGMPTARQQTTWGREREFHGAETLAPRGAKGKPEPSP